MTDSFILCCYTACLWHQESDCHFNIQSDARNWWIKVRAA